EQRLTAAGFSPVQVDIRLSPAWTTDWMNADARERLRQYGVAPPQGHTCDRPHAHGPVACPRCGSTHSEKISEFGSTACKALYRCCDCREPFDYFKCI
ncbi:phenylacetate-CoA oxygenase subunit PaaJ, partial [Escherichia coli]|nr:phenylacetate-CoA oxygenase subunit PaaJ [Escherichia coli]